MKKNSFDSYTIFNDLVRKNRSISKIKSIYFITSLYLY